MVVYLHITFALLAVISKMADYMNDRESSVASNGYDSTTRSNPLASKVTSVLSASYADSDIRDALSLLDSRGIENNAETRRQLRLDAQKEVIESHGDIIREFGHVAEVSYLACGLFTILTFM